MRLVQCRVLHFLANFFGKSVQSLRFSMFLVHRTFELKLLRMQSTLCAGWNKLQHSLLHRTLLI